MKKQDEMQTMNMLLAARNAFAIIVIIIVGHMIYDTIKGQYNNEITMLISVIGFSFWGSLIYYSNKREGKDFFRAILPVALIVLITGLIILLGVWMIG